MDRIFFIKIKICKSCGHACIKFWIKFIWKSPPTHKLAINSTTIVSCRKRQLVEWYKFSHIRKEGNSASIFEEERTWTHLFRKVSEFPQGYTASQSRRRQSARSPLWEPQTWHRKAAGQEMDSLGSNPARSNHYANRKDGVLPDSFRVVTRQGLCWDEGGCKPKRFKDAIRFPLK